MECELSEATFVCPRPLEAIIFQGNQVEHTKLQFLGGKYFLRLSRNQVVWIPGQQTTLSQSDSEEIKNTIVDLTPIFNRIHQVFANSRFDKLSVTEMNQFYMVITYKDEGEYINYILKLQSRRLFVVTNALETLIIKQHLQEVLSGDDIPAIQDALELLNSQSRVILALSLLNSGIIPYSQYQESRFRIGSGISCAAESVSSFLITFSPDFPTQAKQHRNLKTSHRYSRCDPQIRDGQSVFVEVRPLPLLHPAICQHR